MSTQSNWKERFGQLGLPQSVAPSRSYSDVRIAQELVLTGAFDKRLSVYHCLRDAGLSMRAGYNALNALAETTSVICEIPEDVDLDTLAVALAPLNVALRRRRTSPDSAAFLVEVRNRHGLSQRQFADRLGFDVRTLQNWEQGRNKPDAAILNLVRIFDRDPKIVADAMFEPI